jgi:hypothetical protein
VRAKATSGCSFEARFAECMEPTITRDVFRAASCAKFMINIIDAFEIVLGPFCRVSVISKLVASSDKWCANNAFGDGHLTVPKIEKKLRWAKKRTLSL